MEQRSTREDEGTQSKPMNQTLKQECREFLDGVWMIGLVLMGMMAFLSCPVGPPDALGNPVVVFGPQKFERSKGKPTQVVAKFSVQNPEGAFSLRLDNGGLNGECRRVSSGVILLNGVKVLGPNAFNQTIKMIEQAVTLQAVI